MPANCSTKEGQIIQEQMQQKYSTAGAETNSLTIGMYRFYRVTKLTSMEALTEGSN